MVKSVELTPEVLQEMAAIMCAECSQRNTCDHVGRPHWVGLAIESPDKGGESAQ